MPANLMPQLKATTTALSTALALEDILVVLDAYHQRQLEKLQEIRSGISELNLDIVTQTALRLEAFTAPSRKDYLIFLTQHIMALLDGGDGPILPMQSQKTDESILC